MRLRRPKLPPQRRLAFPADVADKGALREMLAQTDVFGQERAEAESYLDDALERFRITMALIPPLAPGAKVLELGSNPYFVTRLLRQRGLEVQAANWFGERSEFGDRGVQRVVESGIPHEYEFDHFNIEEARFPYEDSSFDLVLFCEILEHLPHNPTHALVEIHRVLRDGGQMLLTTPNANRLENLIKVQRGENMYEPLSGYGPYGRHNREYTVSELQVFLEGCGFAVEDIFAQDLRPWPDQPVLVPGLDLEHRGENLFLMARTRPPRRWNYPPWLYTSIHGFLRVVREDVVVGVNCAVQATGLHHLEEINGRPGRWTIGNAEASVSISSPTAGPGVIRIEGWAPDIGGTIELRAATSQDELSWTLPCNGRAFDVEGKAHLDGGEQTIRIWTDRFWRPCDLMDSPDDRALGIVLHRISTNPPFGKPAGSDDIVGSKELQLDGVHTAPPPSIASASPVPLSRRVFRMLPPQAQALARKVVSKLRT